ncbi:MAG: zinc ribbon domain-containing protein [Nitrososphaeraceae archaeon]
MKVFDGRKATEEYMSTHSLTFSTPEMTLKKFVLWLSEYVNYEKSEVPRIILYLKDKKESKNEDLNSLLPDIDETFKPTGAVTDMFNTINTDMSPNSIHNSTDINNTTSNSDKFKFCIECGYKQNSNSKFCIKCGTRYS